MEIFKLVLVAVGSNWLVCILDDVFIYFSVFKSSFDWSIDYLMIKYKLFA